MRLASDSVTHQAAAWFVRAALEASDSLFTPGRRVWSLPNVEELYQAFVMRPDESSDSFLVKFKRQLSDVSDDVKQLAAELLWFHFLAPTGTSGDKKREIIGQVLSWMDEPPAVPKDIGRVLDHGFVKGGFAFTGQRPFQLSFLLEFLRHWKGLSPPEVKRALEDPWAFRDAAWSVRVLRGHSQREALLYLLHPCSRAQIFGASCASPFGPSCGRSISLPAKLSNGAR